jgi:hypothetical protein
VLCAAITTKDGDAIFEPGLQAKGQESCLHRDDRAENSVRANRSRTAVGGAAISANHLTIAFHHPYRRFAYGVPKAKEKPQASSSIYVLI